jgi:hypothetical protein
MQPLHMATAAHAATAMRCEAAARLSELHVHCRYMKRTEVLVSDLRVRSCATCCALLALDHDSQSRWLHHVHLCPCRPFMPSAMPPMHRAPCTPRTLPPTVLRLETPPAPRTCPTPANPAVSPHLSHLGSRMRRQGTRRSLRRWATLRRS